MQVKNEFLSLSAQPTNRRKSWGKSTLKLNFKLKNDFLDIDFNKKNCKNYQNS